MKTMKFSALIVAFIGLLFMPACDVTIDAPHLIEDELFNDPEFMTVLVNGAFGDFAFATANETGGIYHAAALLTDELIHIGSFSGFNNLSRGAHRRMDVEMRTFWAQTSRARWVAENAVNKFEEFFDDPGSDPRYVLSLLLAGHGNRLIADFFDFVVIDGGPQQTREAGYQRARQFFQNALTYATNIGHAQYQNAAHAGLAHVSAMLGDWEAVVTHASQVPIGFVFEQIHSRNSSREENMYAWWAHDRRESGGWGTPYAQWGTIIDGRTGEVIQEGDPRVVFDYIGLGGFTLTNVPGYRQKKFYYGDNIPISKGTEMRLLLAEEALLRNAIGDAMGHINAVRAHHGLDPLAEPTTIEEAWDVYTRERGIELWLEGKRLPDLRRWAVNPGREYVNVEVVRIRSNAADFIANPTYHNVYYDFQGALIPNFSLLVSDREFDTNPNL